MKNFKHIATYFKDQNIVQPIVYSWSAFLSKRESFNLFGYGSLINEYELTPSAGLSNKLIPVMGYGIKRILNYNPDKEVISRPMYQDPLRGAPYYAAFNLEYTGNSTNYANGVIRKIYSGDFENFVNREKGYSVVKIPCTPFDDSSSEIIEAYTLIAPKIYKGAMLVDNRLLPNVPYYRTCKEGAAKISEEFLSVWLKTSFLGDGRNVQEWEALENGI